MVRQSNPYRPGYNQTPLVVAGREGLMHDAHDALEIAAYDGRTPRPLILTGPRGVGKTVTLGEIADLAARELSWPTVSVECTGRASLIVDLTHRLLQVTQILEGRAPDSPRQPRRAHVSGGKVAAHAFGVGGELQVEVDRSRQPEFDDALAQAMSAAVDRGAGLVISLDELQAASAADVGLLFAALQQRVSEDWPLLVVVAALPSIRTSRGKNKMPTYLERAEWHELGPLDADDARHALTGPAADAGRPMTREAADALLALASGYPYAIQVAGHFAWRASHEARSITVDHARAARPRIESDLEQLFKSRWEDSSQREREYLQAVAELDAAGAPTAGAVAAALGAEPSEVSYLRDRLIRKGTIYAAPDRRIHFITPGMAGWLRAQSGQ